MKENKNEIYKDNDFENWKKRWNERLISEGNTIEKSIKLMKTVNPLVIPRNHNIEEALAAAEKNDLKKTNQLLKILANPYLDQEDISNYRSISTSKEKYQTFCGT